MEIHLRYITTRAHAWKYRTTRANAWKYAAGQDDNGTEKTNASHKSARLAVNRKVILRVIGLKEESERTLHEQDIFQKATPPRHVHPLLPFPPSWKPDLDTEAREHAWRFAAGIHSDESEKIRNTHGQARNRIIHMDGCVEDSRRQDD